MVEEILSWPVALTVIVMVCIIAFIVLLLITTKTLKIPVFV